MFPTTKQLPFPWRPAAFAVLTAFAVPTAAHAAAPTAAHASDSGRVFRAAPSKPVKPRIVGGTEIQVASAPWQVYIESDPDQDPSTNDGSSCGGTIIDATHVVTAAHCTFSRVGNAPVDAGGSYTVVAGVSNADPSVNEPGDTPQVHPASAVRRHPYYVSPGGSGNLEQFADDAAVLTLATPLTFNGNIQAAALPTGGSGPLEGTGVSISGFGLQADGAPAPDGNLYQVGENLIDSSDPARGAGAVNALWLVGVGTTGSSCQGDSGGPIVTGSPATLVGIVSNGAFCGPNEPDNFTNVSAPEVLDFINGSDAPPRAPRGGQDVTLSATRAPIRTGDTLTCSPGTWSNAPSFSFTFVDTRNGQVLQSGPSATYTTVAGDVGRTINCRATATGAGGVGRTPATQATPAVVAAPTPPPAPKPPAPKPPKPPAKPKAAKLSAKLTSASSRIKPGSRVGFRLTVRNTGGTAAKSVRSCVRISSKFTVSSRGGGKLSKGKLCWTTSSLKKSTTKRFTLRADRDAKAGKVKTTVKVTASKVKSASASRTVRIVRRATRPAPGGVTG